MEFHAEVRIELKPGITDAEGETVQKSLELLSYPIKKVSSVKVYSLSIDAKSKQEAEKKLDDACKRLLANPVINNYSISIE